MASKLFTILVILPAIYAKIQIDIHTNDDQKMHVHMAGASVSMLGEIDKATFGLTDDNLKQAITNMGMKPDNVFLNSPTPWGDLFKTMNWEPTRMIFEPKKAEILSVKTEQVLVKSNNVYNKHTEPITHKVDMRQTVMNTISSKWSKEGELEVKNIHYNVLMKTPESGEFSFISKGSEDIEKLVPITVGDLTEITLEPKQKLVAELYATAEHTMVRVDFEAKLAGTVALNFDNKFEGHRFWSVDINTLLTAGGLKKVMHFSEIIEVIQFTDTKVLVKDAATDKVVYSVPLTMQ
ncbi:unnamed protein product [Euphydryas editha]|uniref:Uncharacterized protein n=1 Tax=Euphydryas editha TaxID=104508 RepID=A0AAU9UM49_EUPED|nr:unnamed protein product [Euphydryas editha]